MHNTGGEDAAPLSGGREYRGESNPYKYDPIQQRPYDRASYNSREWAAQEHRKPASGGAGMIEIADGFLNSSIVNKFSHPHSQRSPTQTDSFQNPPYPERHHPYPRGEHELPTSHFDNRDVAASANLRHERFERSGNLESVPEDLRESALSLPNNQGAHPPHPGYDRGTIRSHESTAINPMEEKEFTLHGAPYQSLSSHTNTRQSTMTDMRQASPNLNYERTRSDQRTSIPEKKYNDWVGIYPTSLDDRSNTELANSNTYTFPHLMKNPSSNYSTLNMKSEEPLRKYNYNLLFCLKL